MLRLPTWVVFFNAILKGHEMFTITKDSPPAPMLCWSFCHWRNERVHSSRFYSLGMLAQGIMTKDLFKAWCGEVAFNLVKQLQHSRRRWFWALKYCYPSSHHSFDLPFQQPQTSLLLIIIIIDTALKECVLPVALVFAVANKQLDDRLATCRA